MSKAKSKKVRPKQSHRLRRAKKSSPSAASRSKSLAAKGKSSPRRGAPTGTPRKAAPGPLVRRRPTPEEIAYQNSLARFEKGLQYFNQNQFARARAIFGRLTENSVRELAERARIYINICDQRMARPSLHLKTADDLYNYAVGLANQGNPEEAEQHLKKALKLAPKADHIYYALASTHALRENLEGALENLLKAIALNERNRYQAQNDSDFASLLEDPRFTELLYPEKPLS